MLSISSPTAEAMGLVLSYSPAPTTLARFVIAHLNHGELDGSRLLSASTLDEMWTAQVEFGLEEWLGPMASHFGAGWVVGTVGDHRSVSGLGADPGYQAAAMLFPDDQAAVVSMVNIMDWDEDLYTRMLSPKAWHG